MRHAIVLFGLPLLSLVAEFVPGAIDSAGRPWLAPPSAMACGNAVYLSRQGTEQLLAEAQRFVEARKYSEAVRILQGRLLMTRVQQTKYDRVLAAAHLGLRYIGVAVAEFETLLSQKPKDPYLQTRLGEALSLQRGTAHHERARGILEALAKSDLITDAEGYAALARLRAEAGDTAASEKARKRCEQMTNKDDLCAVPASPSPSPSPSQPAS